MPSNRYTSLPTNGSSSDISPLPQEHPQDSESNNNADINTDSIPDLPPAYEPSSFESFEIDESGMSDQNADYETRNFRSKAEMFAQSFSRNVVQPIHNALDPIYQLYCYSNAKFEYYVSKMGNPLIVKRILYIFVIATILYFVSLSGIQSDVVGTHSDFTDSSKLLEFVDLSVDPKRLEENLEYLSSMPHLAGTAGDLALSKYFMQLIRQSKLSLSSDVNYEAYTNYPNDPKVELFNGDSDELLLSCDLKETLNDDKNSNDFYKLAFNPGSRDSSTRGKLIYANYGTLADYRMLESKSIDVKGCILLIKYGGTYPAYKKLEYAQSKGAIGVLFISDPEMDDYYNIDSIQRDPVAFSDIYPGNILGYGNNAGANIEHNGDLLEELSESAVIASIPSIPIKWKDFISIMDKLSNQGSRIEEWDIQIDNKQIPIWSGQKDEIYLQNSLTQRPNKESWNVLGKLQGSEQDTFGIIIGASRDTLCYGATESSGSAILLELINVFSEMTSSLFWSPLRTIYFASYSGSKYNMAGITNFAVKYSDFFRRDVYAYIDLDDIIQGNDLELSVDPLFESLIKNAVKALVETNTNESHVNIDKIKDASYSINPTSNSLPLLEHHNIASISVKLTNNENSKDNFNKIHYPKNSCLDTFDNFRKNLLDPDMSKHVFMTKLLSSIIIKLADTPILPYDVRNMFDGYKESISDVKKYLNSLPDDKKSNLHFNNLDASLDRALIIAEQHEAFVATWSEICDDGKGSEPNLLSVNRWDWNSKLLIMTKVMIDTDGTFGDHWNYNVFYGRETNPERRNFADDKGEVDIKQRLPGIWNAIDASDWNSAQKQIDQVNKMIERCISLFQY